MAISIVLSEEQFPFLTPSLSTFFYEFTFLRTLSNKWNAFGISIFTDNLLAIYFYNFTRMKREFMDDYAAIFNQNPRLDP